MIDRGIIDTFDIFRVFKAARIFDKSFGHDAYGVKENPRHFAGEEGSRVVSIRFGL